MDTTPATPHTLGRRTMLGMSGAAAASLTLAHLAPARAEETEPVELPAHTGAPHQAFQHGVASGDPYPRSVILWTRVTTTPEDTPGSGRGTPTEVVWEIARDDTFTRPVASGRQVATPATDGTIKVEAAGLQPHTRYYYRFRIASGPLTGQASPTGRTLTAPDHGHPLNRLRFGLMSCANWEAGYFHAYGDAATRGDLDMIVHVGDYIYEYGTGEYAAKGGRVIRPHVPAHEIITLADYRARYGNYRTDKHLQAAHAACPWIVTWDDHEVTNDAWDTGAENHTPDTEGDFHSRRNDAMQAYLEWLPIRALPFTQGGRIYRSLSFGNLCELNMLDLRSYRSEYATAKATNDPSRTMLGSEQYSWLAKKLTTTNATWSLVGNPVMMAPILLPPLDPDLAGGITELTGLARDGYAYISDMWDGFTVERWRLLEMLHRDNIDCAVFLTGDIHTSWAAELPLVPARYRAGDCAAVEFVCPSVNSANIDDMLNLPSNSPLTAAAAAAVTTINPYLKYCDLERHGYCVIEVTHDYIHCDWIYDTDPHSPEAAMYTGHSMRTTKGDGIYPAPGALNPHDHVLPA